MAADNNNSTLSRRDRKKLATRLAIIEAAMSLFKQQGFHETSMEQIAEQSDVSKATLYKYFEVKEAIIAAYWQEKIKNSKDQLQQIITNNPDTRSRLEAAFRSFMQYIMQSRELYEIYISYRMAHIANPHINETLRSGVAENAAAIIQAGQDSGEIRTDIPLKVMVGNMELLSVMQAIAWLRYPEQFSLDDSSKMFAELFLNGAANHAEQ
jgi:AcrR family transcriptional regulator